MALAFTACDEGTPPPVEPPPPPTPVGTISGSVTIEGTAAAGITATLSSGATKTTGAGGNFAFAGVEAGTYTVTISGFPEDATFAQVTQSATIASDGQNVQLNFAGEYIRSSAVVGSVVAADAMMSGGDGQPETLAGVTVTLGGEHAMGEIMETGMDGGFAFTGLRAGTYTVTISDFPEDVSFETVSVEVEVEVGEVGQADFTGHYIRTSAVEGQVVIEGEGLAGVTVTLIGGPADENFTMMTDADGMYRFEDLRPGDYTVSISDFDTRDYEFAATSQDVSVDLDETGTVSFTGVLLRTSGISGRVSVEGMGLGDIAVTLSGAADASTTTDAGGQYAFAGLAAGDYTVSIAVESDAYVFESMSMDRAVGDDESAIVNFEGAHARTASVGGQLFLDELDKNNMMDAGEHPLPAAGVPVALVGPGVNDQRLSATGPDGSFGFSDLRAGSYQLVVPIDATAAAALAAADVAYGGPGTGYAFALGVGEAKSQAIPFDITHTTVNFSVSLKSGDEMGDALPGATVTLYGTGDANVGSGMTGDDGSVAIKVARDRTSGNMVNAGVSADGYDVADGMTAVSWDPQMFATAGANENDIVNLNVDVSISGATVMTDYGGGEALAGWEIAVMMGDAAVAGAPTMLGDDGSVPFTTTVDSVPASFTFSVADNQDDDLDGGEMYEASGGGYTHKGLSVAGTVDADPIVVSYTTQTLKVYVHHEQDQVMGYTGNVLGGDRRMEDELVDIEIRQVSGNDGRLTRPISRDDWDARENTTHDTGEYTFAHLPANMDIVVRANAKDGYKLLDLDRLDTYRNMEENGVMGGAFGDMGGWGHTVTLCPLTEVEPTGQDFGKCSSFAVVTTHNVKANVSKQAVQKRGTTFRVNHHTITRQSGIEVSLTPIEGKNLAGDGRSFTTASSNDPTTAIDERRDHNFGTMAAGSYELGLPDGWMGMAGDMKADDALNPLASDLDIKVTPSTATLYGFVRSTDGFGLENVTVSVNGESATTDNLGRFIVSGITNNMEEDQLFVNTARAGYPETKPDSTNNPKYDPTHSSYDANSTPVPGFAANTVERYDFTLYGSNNTVTISGTVTESGTGAGVKGVEILVDNADPLNATGSGASRKLVTDDNGAYTAVVQAQPFEDPLVNVSAKLSGWHFLPESFPVPAIAGSSGTANFEGRRAAVITGMVTAPGGGPMADVRVTAWDHATSRTSADSIHAVVTTGTGTFSVQVPTLSGTVWLDAKPRDITHSDVGATYSRLMDAQRYVWFDAPDTRAGGAIAVIPGQPLMFGTFTGNSVQPRVTAKRLMARETTGTVAGGDFVFRGDYTADVEVTWEYEAASTTTGEVFSVAVDATPIIETRVGTAAFSVSGASAASAVDATLKSGTTKTYTRKDTISISTAGSDHYGEFDVQVSHPAGDGSDGTAFTDPPASDATVDAVDTNVRSVSAERDGDDPKASWTATASPGLTQRIVLLVEVATTGEREWLIVPADPAGDASHGVITREDDRTSDWGDWTWELDISATLGSPWTHVDISTSTFVVTEAMLKKPLMLRVESQADGGDWVIQESAAKSIP